MIMISGGSRYRQRCTNDSPQLCLSSWLIAFASHTMSFVSLVRQSRPLVQRSFRSAQATRTFWGSWGGREEVVLEENPGVTKQVGKNLRENLDAVEGKETWKLDAVDAKHFGTVANPVLVPSAEPSRFIACTGGVEGTAHHHALKFMEIKAGELSACQTCGQVFAVETIEEPKVDYPTYL